MSASGAGRVAGWLAVLCIVLAVAGCAHAPSDADARRTIVDYLSGNHFGADSVDLNRLCAGAGRESAQGEFLGVGDVTSIGSKRVMAQGLSHWYVKTVWPVKAALRLKCGSGAYDTITADQEFELEYDGNTSAWDVSAVSWGPWVESWTETDVLRWDFYAALIVAALAGFVIAIRQDGAWSRRWGLGTSMGAVLGWIAAILFAIYAGFRYQIAEYTSPPGFWIALGLGIFGVFIGLFGGFVGGTIGALLGARLAARS